MLGVLDEGAVVVDLVGVEAEVVVYLEGGAGRAGGGEDDFDAALTDLLDGFDGFEAEPLVGGEEGAIEVEGDEVEASPGFAVGGGGGGGRAGGGAGGLGAEAAAAELLVEVELVGGDEKLSG